MVQTAGLTKSSTPATLIVLPTQLFEVNDLIKKDTTVIVYEHPTYFTMYNYHKMKLVMHRATMKRYSDEIAPRCKKVIYVEYGAGLPRLNSPAIMYDPVDFSVNIDAMSRALGSRVSIVETPAFLTPRAAIAEFVRSSPKGYHVSFYIWQRKRLGVLVDKNSKPIGGKWSFDAENRNPFQSTYVENFGAEMQTYDKLDKQYIEEAKRYVARGFSQNPGSSDLYMPISWDGAKKHLVRFVATRLANFGKYEDGAMRNVVLGYHSLLSPLTNIGLVSPRVILDVVLKCARGVSPESALFASIEGFVRQLIGWREYSRLIYITKHKELVALNHFGHRQRLPKSWYTGNVGVAPIDTVIKRVLQYGYAHHIERLMYLGNFMLLTHILPRDAHDWFMCMFLDSYHVFMEPNVYGMALWSCGAIMMSRPYFSASNYIDKMSDWKKKPGVAKVVCGKGSVEWYELFDALYYNFINDNQEELRKNYSTSSAVSMWARKDTRTKNIMLDVAKSYLNGY